jgi:hypothetical protein
MVQSQGLRLVPLQPLGPFLGCLSRLSGRTTRYLSRHTEPASAKSCPSVKLQFGATGRLVPDGKILVESSHLAAEHWRSMGQRLFDRNDADAMQHDNTTRDYSPVSQDSSR